MPEVPLEPDSLERWLSGLSGASRMMLAIRLTRHWTQARLARRLGVSVRTIQRWEAGDTEPPVFALMIFRALLKVKDSPEA